MLNKKIIVNLGINVIIQENIEVLKIAYVTLIKVYPKKFI